MKGLTSLLAIWMLFLSVQTCLCEQDVGGSSAQEASSVVLLMMEAPDKSASWDYCSGHCCLDYLLMDAMPLLPPLAHQPPFPALLRSLPASEQADIFTPPRLS